MKDFLLAIGAVISIMIMCIIISFIFAWAYGDITVKTTEKTTHTPAPVKTLPVDTVKTRLMYPGKFEIIQDIYTDYGELPAWWKAEHHVTKFPCVSTAVNYGSYTEKYWPFEYIRDSTFVERRREIARAYIQQLKKMKLPKRTKTIIP